MLLLILVFFPMIAAPLVYLLGRRDETVRDRAAVAVVCAEFVLALGMVLTVHGRNLGGLPLDWTSYPPSFAGPFDAPRPVITSGLPVILGLRFTADGFRMAYGLIAAFMWLGTTLFGQEYFREEREGLNAYWCFTLLTLGATEGVMFSADFLTTFTFFEILSLTSFTWVVHERTEGAIRAGYTYLFIAIGGGMVLFLGLLLVQHTCGTLVYAQLEQVVREPGLDAPGSVAALLPAGLCILTGFGAKAGMYPLHVWLPMAHPVAPSPASALLSGILTKVGVYGVLMAALELLYRDFAFGMILLCLGLVTMFLGAVLALFSVNLKRTLACSSMSQIGFILIGIGCTVLARTFGSEEAAAVALSGTMLHMVNHSLLKLVLFLCAGAVVMNLHALTLDDIRGWGRNKPILKFCFALGALGISGVPLLNGYLSKTLLHEGILHVLTAVGQTQAASLSAILDGTAAPFGAAFAGYGLIRFLHIAEWVFLISGGCTFAYMLKLFLCVFVERNADPEKQRQYDDNTRCMDRLSSCTLLACSLLLLPLGQPAVALSLASRMTGTPLHHFQAFAWENLQGGLISLAIGGAVYLLLVRPVLRPHGRYVDRWPKALDLERTLYRSFLAGAVPAAMGAAAYVLAENAVLKPLAHFLATEAGPATAGALAESPLFLSLVLAGAFLARILSDSTDALAVLLRRTVIRELKPRDGQEQMRVSRFRAFRKASSMAIGPFLESFSFALLMTCLGILIIFTLLAVAVL